MEWINECMEVSMWPLLNIPDLLNLPDYHVTALWHLLSSHNTLFPVTYHSLQWYRQSIDIKHTQHRGMQNTRYIPSPAISAVHLFNSPLIHQFFVFIIVLLPIFLLILSRTWIFLVCMLCIIPFRTGKTKKRIGYPFVHCSFINWSWSWWWWRWEWECFS